MTSTASPQTMRACEPLVDARALAEYLGTSVSYVYEHASALGARELPRKPRLRKDGTMPTQPKPRLRFSLAEVDKRLSACTASKQSPSPEPAQQAASRSRRGRALGTSVELLPIRGRILAETGLREAS